MWGRRAFSVDTILGLSFRGPHGADVGEPTFVYVFSMFAKTTRARRVASRGRW
jgi:hypothetical protein